MKCFTCNGEGVISECCYEGVCLTGCKFVWDCTVLCPTCAGQGIFILVTFNYLVGIAIYMGNGLSITFKRRLVRP